MFKFTQMDTLLAPRIYHANTNHQPIVIYFPLNYQIINQLLALIHCRNRRADCRHCLKPQRGDPGNIVSLIKLKALCILFDQKDMTPTILSLYLKLLDCIISIFRCQVIMSSNFFFIHDGTPFIFRMPPTTTVQCPVLMRDVQAQDLLLLLFNLASVFCHKKC